MDREPAPNADRLDRVDFVHRIPEGIFRKEIVMRPIVAFFVLMALPVPVSSQTVPTSELSTEAFIEALTPPARSFTRGLTPQLREQDMPRIDLAVEFEFASHALTLEARALLSNLAEALLAPSLAGHRFRLAGHTDAVGTDEANDRLSLERADAVRHFLVTEYGIASERLEVAGYGKRRLLFEEAPEDARNRRVEVSVIVD